MGTKRIESIGDCWRHGIPVCIACRTCGHYRVIEHLEQWVEEIGGRTASFFDVAAKRFRCSRCGGKDVVVAPGDRPRLWKGNR